MKALSICQPYPHLILIGEKLVENREWRTDYRGPLLLHAGKSRQWLQGYPAAGLTFGAIVGVATLVDCLHINDILDGAYDQRHPWIRTHKHTEGTWCWVLERPQRLEMPSPWRGSLGLFEVDSSALGIHYADSLAFPEMVVRDSCAT